MSFVAACVQWKTPLRLRSMTSCHCSGFMRIMSVSRVIPALFTSTSTCPYAAMVSSKSVATSSRLATFAPTMIASPPASSMLAFTSSAAPLLDA